LTRSTISAWRLEIHEVAGREPAANDQGGPAHQASYKPKYRSGTMVKRWVYNLLDGRVHPDHWPPVLCPQLHEGGSGERCHSVPDIRTQSISKRQADIVLLVKVVSGDRVNFRCYAQLRRHRRHCGLMEHFVKRLFRGCHRPKWCFRKHYSWSWLCHQDAIHFQTPSGYCASCQGRLR
jgi:hypothetical protein